MTKFKKGDLVRLSPLGLTKGLYRRSAADLRGVVVGRGEYPHSVLVLWAGEKSADDLSEEFIAVVSDVDPMGKS